MKIFGLIFFLFASAALAAPTTFGPNAQVSWTYPAADLSRIEGYQAFINGAQTAIIAADKLNASLKSLKPVTGENKLKIRAYAGKDVSEFSNEVTFSYTETPLPAPAGMKITLTFTSS